MGMWRAEEEQKKRRNRTDGIVMVKYIYGIEEQ